MAMGRAYSASLVLLLPSLLLWKPSLAAADRFVSGETFSAQRTITSNSGDFGFGFFNLSDDSSTSPSPRWYVGIWYANAASLTVAWVANRENPISTNQLSFTFLSITNESSLQLITNGSIFWSTKCFSKRATAAVIQNDGREGVHHPMLVYEFMPNGSLASRLFYAGHRLDWKKRFAVAVAAARALEYLHDGCRERIIHCDIKPENILLDAQFQAKIADFGLAKMLGRDFSRVLTSMRGTRGYLAPEWLSGQAITDKADVYSFGRTLLEIVTGRRVYGSGDEQSLFYPAWAAAAINAGNAMAVVDTRLKNEPGMEEEQVRRAACMALWCVQDEEGARPAMRDVVKTLLGLAQLPEQRPPVPASIRFAADTSTTTYYSATSNLTTL